MIRFALIVASTLGFFLTAALGNFMVPLLRAFGPGQEPEAPQTSQLQPNSDPDDLPPPATPTMGGLCLMVGTLAAVGVGWTAACAAEPALLGDEGLWTTRLLIALFGALAFGAVGLADDLARLRRHAPLGLRRPVRLGLEAAAAAAVQVLLAANHCLATGLVLPGLGYCELGVLAPIVWGLLLVGLAESARVADGADGVVCGSAFLGMLGLMGAMTILGWFPLGVLPAALAGALMALLLWNFPPAKLLPGSVGSLFLAGYLPGALLAIVLMIGSYIISVKENYPKGSPFTIKGFIKQLGTSIWALAAVVIVVFGVVGGVFTATESAAIAVIYSLLVSVFVYKGLDWKGVWYALDECVNTLSIVLILIATSAVFGNCLTMLHVPDLAANAITSVTSNPYIIALLIDLIILVLGCIMDMAPIILIATPILLPIATSIGIDPIQFGIIMVLNCGIGLLTPPVGAVLFIGSAVAKRPMEKVVRATLPFYLCMFIALLLLTYVPDISLAIPKLLGGYVSPIANPLGPVFIH